MHVHLVFVAKYRREVFTKEILVDLRSIFAGVCNDFEAELVEFDGEHDHVHLLLNYHPKVAVSMAIGTTLFCLNDCSLVQFIYAPDISIGWLRNHP